MPNQFLNQLTWVPYNLQNGQIGWVPQHLQYLWLWQNWLPWQNGNPWSFPWGTPPMQPRKQLRKRSTVAIGTNMPSPTPAVDLNTMAWDTSWIWDAKWWKNRRKNNTNDILWPWPKVWFMDGNNKRKKKLVPDGQWVDIDRKTGKPKVPTNPATPPVPWSTTPWWNTASGGTTWTNTVGANTTGGTTTTTTGGTTTTWWTTTWSNMVWWVDTTNMNPYQKQMLEYQTKIEQLQSDADKLPDTIRWEFPTSLTKWEYNAILNNRTKQIQDQIGTYSKQFNTAKWYYEANRGEQDRIASMLNNPDTLSQMTVWQLDDLKKSGYLNDQYYNIYKGQIVWSLVDGLQKVASANRKPLTEQEIGMIQTQFNAGATPQQIMAKLYNQDKNRFEPWSAYKYENVGGKLYRINPNDPTDVSVVNPWDATPWYGWWTYWWSSWWPVQSFTLNNGKTIHGTPWAWNAFASAINNLWITIDYNNQYRTADQQMRIYGEWRTAEQLIAKWVPPEYAKPNLSRKTNTLNSEHMKGNAFDVVPPKWTKDIIWYFNNLDAKMLQYGLYRPEATKKMWDYWHYVYKWSEQWWWKIDQSDISVFNSMTPTDRKKSQSDPLYKSFVTNKNTIMKDRNAKINDVLDYSMWWTNINQTQETQLTKFSQALDQLSSISEKIKQVNTWPIVGILKSKNPYDTKAQELKAMMTSLIPNLARWVYGEVWVLTDADVELYSKTIPNLKSTKEVNDAILSMTLKAIWSWYKRKLQSMAAWWFDVSWYWWLYDELTWKANAMLWWSNTWWSTTPQFQFSLSY